jgi:hypothetical protein
MIRAGKLTSYDRYGDKRVYIDMDEARKALDFRRRDGD